MAAEETPGEDISRLAKEVEDARLEDEDWELEEGIPQFSDPFIQKYYAIWG